MKINIFTISMLMVPGIVQAQSMSADINYNKDLITAVYYIIYGRDADPSLFTKTGYHEDNSAERSSLFGKKIISDTDIKQTGDCKIEVVEHNTRLDPGTGTVGPLVMDTATYDFHKLSGSIYYDKQFVGGVYSVKATGSKGASCVNGSCSDSISAVRLTIIDRDRTIKAFTYIAKKFCSTEEKPF